MICGSFLLFSAPISRSPEYCFIVSELNGLVLDIHGGSVQGGKIQTFPQKKGQNCDNQLWHLDENGFLRSKTGFVADIQGANSSKSTNVIAWPKKSHGTANQQWVFRDGRMRSKLNNMVMDINGENSAPCTNIIMWPEKTSGNANQLWRMVPESEMNSGSSSGKRLL